MDNSQENKEEKPLHYGFSVAQWRLFFIVLAIGLAGIFFHLLVRKNVDHSAALYVGLPFLFALFLSLTPKAGKGNAVFKGLTIALLLSAPVLMEGFICILFAAPIFYGVAGIVVYLDGKAEKRAKKGGDKLQLPFITIVAALSVASFEGVSESLSFDRHNTVAYSRIVDASAADIKAQLAKKPTFEQPRALFTRIFPLPEKVEGQGIKVGDKRRLHYVYNKWIFFKPHVGDTVFEVVDAQADSMRFAITHDDSYLSHYLTWTDSAIKMEAIDEKTTKVTWQLSYIRKLDPIWYFGPMQHYAAKMTAKALIDNVADPQS